MTRRSSDEEESYPVYSKFASQRICAAQSDELFGVREHLMKTEGPLESGLKKCTNLLRDSNAKSQA